MNDHHCRVSSARNSLFFLVRVTRRVDHEFLAVLRCPITKSALAPAGDDLVGKINRAIEAGAIENRNLRRLERPMEDALVNRDRTFVYPVYDGTPHLMEADAIDCTSIDRDTDDT